MPVRGPSWHESKQLLRQCSAIASPGEKTTGRSPSIRVHEFACSVVYELPHQPNSAMEKPRRVFSSRRTRKKLLSAGWGTAKIWIVGSVEGRDPLLERHHPSGCGYTRPEWRLDCTGPAYDASRGGEESTLIRLWSVREAKPTSEFEGHTGSVTDLRWTGDGKRLVSCGVDQFLICWNLDGTTSAEAYFDADIENLALAPDERFLACGCYDTGSFAFGIPGRAKSH